MTNIKYTFALDCPVAQLRGITVYGGEFCRTDGKHQGEFDAVRFDTIVDGRRVTARIAGKPELEAALTAHKAAEATIVECLAAINWPQYQKVQSRYINAQYAYEQASEHGYPVRQAAAATDAFAALEDARLLYPLAAAYAKAENYSMAANYAKANAGRSAMRAIEIGADVLSSIDDMEKTWMADAERLVQNA